MLQDVCYFSQNAAVSKVFDSENSDTLFINFGKLLEIRKSLEIILCCENESIPGYNLYCVLIRKRRFSAHLNMVCINRLRGKLKL